MDVTGGPEDLEEGAPVCWMVVWRLRFCLTFTNVAGKRIRGELVGSRGQNMC